jgi:hypothetical protein
MERVAECIVGFLQRSPNILIPPQCGAVFLLSMSQAYNKVGGVLDEHLNIVVDSGADFRARGGSQSLGFAPRPQYRGEAGGEIANARALTGYSQGLR